MMRLPRSGPKSMLNPKKGLDLDYTEPDHCYRASLRSSVGDIITSARSLPAVRDQGRVNADIAVDSKTKDQASVGKVLQLGLEEARSNVMDSALVLRVMLVTDWHQIITKSKTQEQTTRKKLGRSATVLQAPSISVCAEETCAS